VTDTGLLAAVRDAARFDHPSDRTWKAPTLAVVVLGFAIRLAWSLHNGNQALHGDPYVYHFGANLLARGKGFVSPADYQLLHQTSQYAGHPPLFMLYLSIWSSLGLHTILWHRIAGTMLGTASIVVLACVGRRLGGDRVGVLTGLLVAIAPNMWIWDGTVYSETMAIFVVSLFLLMVVRYLKTPSARGLWAVAAAGAFAGLARSELVLLVLAVIPLVLVKGAFDRREGLKALGACVGFVALILAPWAIYNQTRFHHPVPLSTGFGLALVGGDCPTMWYGPLTGYWSFRCDAAAESVALRPTVGPNGQLQKITDIDTSDLDLRLRKVAEDYVKAHESRIPAVVAARLGRETGLYRPYQQAKLMDVSEGAPLWLAGIIMSTWYLFALLGIAGAVVLRRARVPLIALASPIVPVIFITALTFSLGRYRAPAETVVVLFGAVAIDFFVRRFLERDAAPADGSLLATAAAARAEPAESPESAPVVVDA
jgi:4-amino-4-deoxy-L-arabinose transferase-like glycosyltransferase